MLGEVYTVDPQTIVSCRDSNKQGIGGMCYKSTTKLMISIYICIGKMSFNNEGEALVKGFLNIEEPTGEQTILDLVIV